VTVKKDTPVRVAAIRANNGPGRRAGTAAWEGGQKTVCRGFLCPIEVQHPSLSLTVAHPTLVVLQTALTFSLLSFLFFFSLGSA